MAWLNIFLLSWELLCLLFVLHYMDTECPQRDVVFASTLRHLRCVKALGLAALFCCMERKRSIFIFKYIYIYIFIFIYIYIYLLLLLFVIYYVYIYNIWWIILVYPGLSWFIVLFLFLSKFAYIAVMYNNVHCHFGVSPIL